MHSTVIVGKRRERASSMNVSFILHIIVISASTQHLFRFNQSLGCTRENQLKLGANEGDANGKMVV